MDNQNQFLEETELPVNTPDQIRYAAAVFLYRRNLTIEHLQHLVNAAPGTVPYYYFISAIGLHHSTLNNTTTPTAEKYAKKVRDVFNSKKSSTFTQEYPELQFGYHGIMNRANNNMAKQHADHLGPADLPPTLQHQAPPPQQQQQHQPPPIQQHPIVNSPYHQQQVQGQGSTQTLQQNNRGGIGHLMTNPGYASPARLQQQPSMMNNQLPTPQQLGSRGIQQGSIQYHPPIQQPHPLGGANMYGGGFGLNGSGGTHLESQGNGHGPSNGPSNNHQGGNNLVLSPLRSSIQPGFMHQHNPQELYAPLETHGTGGYAGYG